MLADADIRRLVERHSTRGPRYTSYPTAPQWSRAPGPELYREVLADYRSGHPLALYVHVPFCRRLCLYCGCNVRITRRRDLVERYLAALRREVDEVAALLPGAPPAAQLHFGGGTPTYLAPEELAGLVDHIDARLPPAPGAERSVEVDPRVTTEEHLAALRERGFTRVSAGVQDLDPDVQAAIRREYRAEQLADFVAACRRLGFSGVHIDLIYGLPEQSEETWSRTLEAVIDLRPDRVAVYGYAHVPWLKPHQKGLERYRLPQPEDRLSMALQVRRAFVDAGYLAIGMDHFALPEDELAAAFRERRVHRNFMGYTVQDVESMAAFGPSAIGDFPAAYVKNDPHLESYCERIEEAGLATSEQHRMSEDDRIRRRLIVRLMGNFAVYPAELSAEFGIDFFDYFADEALALDRFVEQGLLERDRDGWRATEAGALVIRNVAMVFDRYLEPDHGAARRYSATI